MQPASASAAPADDRPSAILDAAEALFREVGYAKTTMADIAKALRMSSANIYRFFPSKGAINDAICRRMLAGLHVAMRAAAAGPGSPAERLAVLILATHRLHRDLLTDQRRVHDMVETALAESWDAVEEHKNVCDEIVAGLIREGVASGDFAPVDADSAAETVMGACSSLFHPTMIAQCFDPADPDPERDARRLCWLMVEALRNPHRSPMP